MNNTPRQDQNSVVAVYSQHSAAEDAIKQAALDSDIVRAAQNGSTIRKVIVVPGRLVNVVVK